MSTSNFCYRNRCIVVENDRFFSGDYPDFEANTHYLSDRNYSSHLLIDQPPECSILQAVITYGYYEALCIDYMSFPYDVMTDEEEAEAIKREAPIMEAFLDKLRDDYALTEVRTIARLSNGETIYERV